MIRYMGDELILWIIKVWVSKGKCETSQVITGVWPYGRGSIKSGIGSPINKLQRVRLMPLSESIKAILLGQESSRRLN